MKILGSYCKVHYHPDIKSKILMWDFPFTLVKKQNKKGISIQGFVIKEY